MDPISAGLTLATAIVTLITKVWDATPDAQKATSASDVASTLHNCSTFLQAFQTQINTAAGVK
jgi:hypothetical protein